MPPFAFFSRKKREPGWLALQCSEGGASLAHVRSKGDGRPEVLLCAESSFGAQFGHDIAKLAKQFHLDRYNCTLLLNQGEYQLVMLEAPGVPEAELRTAVKWRIKDMLDFPVDEATVDVLEIPGEGGASSRGRSVYGVAGRNEVIRRAMEGFDGAKLALKAIDIPELAQRNIAALLEPPGRALALLSFSEDGGLLTFTSGGEIYSARHIDIPLSHMQREDSEQKQLVFDRVTLELQRSLDHFDRQFHYLPLSKLVLAPLPGDVNLEAYLASNLYIAVESMNLDDIFDFAPVAGLTADVKMRCFLTLGAALRSEGAPGE